MTACPSKGKQIMSGVRNSLPLLHRRRQAPCGYEATTACTPLHLSNTQFLTPSNGVEQGFRARASGPGLQGQGFGARASGPGLQGQGFKARASKPGLQGQGFRARALGPGLQGQGFKARASGPGLQGQQATKEWLTFSFFMAAL